MASDKENIEMLHTKIWYEQPSADNPFTAEKCFCSGYDVYTDLLPNASYFEYLYLLFMLERPEKWQTEMLEKIAIAIANPGIRDHSVRAAMNAGVGGSTSASSLMAALAVGAGNLGGAREIYYCVELWESCSQELPAWQHALCDFTKSKVDGWPQKEHPPGFDPNSVTCSRPVLETLKSLSIYKQATNLNWLLSKRIELEKIANAPLAMSGVIATGFHDIGFNAEQGEMIYLILRLPGAAAHALEQKHLGWQKYPFFSKNLKVE